MAANVHPTLDLLPLLITICDRAASKDIELENNYLTLLKETSQHEKAIARDLGRLDSQAAQNREIPF